MLEIFHNKKEETLGNKRVLCWMCCLKWKFTLAVGCMSLEFAAGNKKFKPHRVRTEPRPQPWGVSTFRGQAEEERPAEEREEEWPVRPQGHQQWVMRAGGKVFQGGRGHPCWILLREHHWL